VPPLSVRIEGEPFTVRSISIPSQFVESIHEFDNPVERFLNSNSDIREALPVLYKALEKVFPSELVSLDVLEDPSTPEGSKLLVLVELSGDLSQGLERLSQFDQNWWFANRSKYKHRLGVDVRFS
jgi:hypothetical protein